MAVKNPITDALLTLHELTAAEQKARIDYEAAQAKRNLYGQGAVRGVATELAEMRMKKQKQQEAIAKSGEGQQASPQAMVPPTIDVSGQTGGRDMSAALKGVAELAGKVISRGGPQPASQPVQPGMIQGTFGQTTQPPPAVAGGPAPPPQGSLAPGTTYTVPTTQTLSWPERIAGGLTALRGRDFLGALQAAKGEVPAGNIVIREPSQDKLAERVAEQVKTNGVKDIGETFNKYSARYGSEAAGEIINQGLDKARSEVQETIAKQMLEEKKQKTMEDRQERVARLKETLRGGRKTIQAAEGIASIQEDIRTGRAKNWTPEQWENNAAAIRAEQSLTPMNQLRAEATGQAPPGFPPRPGGETPAPTAGAKGVPTTEDIQAAASDLRRRGIDPQPEVLFRELFEVRGFSKPEK